MVSIIQRRRISIHLHIRILEVTQFSQKIVYIQGELYDLYALTFLSNSLSYHLSKLTGWRSNHIYYYSKFQMSKSGSILVARLLHLPWSFILVETENGSSTLEGEETSPYLSWAIWLQFGSSNHAASSRNRLKVKRGKKPKRSLLGAPGAALITTTATKPCGRDISYRWWVAGRV